METAMQIAANSPDAVQAVKRQISDGIAEYGAQPRGAWSSASAMRCGQGVILRKALLHSVRSGSRQI